MATALEQKRNNQLKERAVELEFQINRLGNPSSFSPKNSGHRKRSLGESIPSRLENSGEACRTATCAHLTKLATELSRSNPDFFKRMCDYMHQLWF